MSANLATMAYIAATILFILSLGGLSNPETSRRGNLFGIIGMAIAVLATVFGPRVTPAGLPWIVGALVVGGSIGLYAARKVQMTQMPELVAIMHSLVGLAACLVGFASYVDTSIVVRGRREDDPRGRDLRRHPDRRRDVLGLGHRVRQAVRQDRRQADAAARAPLAQSRRPARGDLVRRAVPAGARHRMPAWCRSIVMTVIALLFGIHMVMAIGGADMPVVVSMLNSYSGLGRGGDRLHAVERPADRHRRAGRLLRRDPVLHHVPRDEPQLHQRHRGRLRHGRRRGTGGGGRAAGRRSDGRSARPRPPSCCATRRA